MQKARQSNKPHRVTTGSYSILFAKLFHDNLPGSKYYAATSLFRKPVKA